jgi:hypothetical protein
MAIYTTQQSMDVSGVGTLTLSETVHDPDQDMWIRELKVFGPALSESGERSLYLTLRLIAPTADALTFTAPIQKF